MEACGWLNEYMMFVNKVKEYHADSSFEELGNDIERAIDYCIDNDILKDFLRTHRSEVTKSMQLNYEFDRQLELERADAREEGREEGRKEGREKINRLNQLLVAEGRFEDLKKSLEDNEYQDKLLRENGLVSDLVLKKYE